MFVAFHVVADSVFFSFVLVESDDIIVLVFGIVVSRPMCIQNFVVEDKV